MAAAPLMLSLPQRAMAQRCKGTLHILQPRPPHAEAHRLPARVAPVNWNLRRACCVQLIPHSHCGKGLGVGEGCKVGRQGVSSTAQMQLKCRLVRQPSSVACSSCPKQAVPITPTTASPEPLRKSRLHPATSASQPASVAAAAWKSRHVSRARMEPPTLLAPAAVGKDSA